MRVTAQVKEQTRQRILESARNFFSKNGLEQTTTRDIATAAGIASGTLFNYFPSKEALAMTIVADALDHAREDYASRLRGTESLEEALFLHIITGLRRLEPYRTSMIPILERAMSCFAPSPENTDADRVRRDHLEVVADILVHQGRREDGAAPQPATALETKTPATDPDFVLMHLYWSLYLGVLAFWSRDESEHQEHTLAVLDQSMQLFVAALDSAQNPENTDATATQ